MFQCGFSGREEKFSTRKACRWIRHWYWIYIKPLSGRLLGINSPTVVTRDGKAFAISLPWIIVVGCFVGDFNISGWLDCLGVARLAPSFESLHTNSWRYIAKRSRRRATTVDTHTKERERKRENVLSSGWNDGAAAFDDDNDDDTHGKSFFSSESSLISFSSSSMFFVSGRALRFLYNLKAPLDDGKKTRPRYLSRKKATTPKSQRPAKSAWWTGRWRVNRVCVPQAVLLLLRRPEKENIKTWKQECVVH